MDRPKNRDLEKEPADLRIIQSSSLSPQHLFVEVSSALLERGHSVRFRAPGRSMLPTIKEGEAITVEPVEPSAVRTGDIILYRNGNSVIAHRVVQIKQETTADKSSLKARRAGPRAKRSLRPEGPIVATHPSSLIPHH